MKLVTLIVSLMIIAAAAESTSTEQEKNAYIYIFPKPAAITLNYTDYYPSLTNSTRNSGKFECATREGVIPLWIINGVSASSVKETPGFENVSSLLFPLIKNHTLTLLYIPGSMEANNSVIICAAVVVQDGEPQIVAYSDPVNFTIFCPDEEATCDYEEGTVISTTASSTLLPTDKGKNTTVVSPHLIAGISTIVVLVLLVVLVATALAVFVCILWQRRKRTSNSLGHSSRTREENVYWGTGNRDSLEDSITTIKSDDGLIAKQDKEK